MYCFINSYSVLKASWPVLTVLYPKSMFKPANLSASIHGNIVCRSPARSVNLDLIVPLPLPAPSM